ncbi:MAG: hypothetical protein LBP91_02070 [Coriobacteriales bacterium]|jgi:hypothetical protein|nr:hypothetical protein [Coriobacteriales bacterium]
MTNLPTEPINKRRGFAVAALVLALIGLLCFSMLALPVIGPFIAIVVIPPALVCALLAIIFAILGLKGTSKTVAILGLILGCLIILLALVLFALLAL